MIFVISHTSRILRFFAFFLVLSGSCLHLYSQTAGDFRTRTADNWGLAGTWERYNGTAWQVAANYPGQNAGTGVVTVRHAVTLNVDPANAIGSLVLEANLTSNRDNASITITNNLVLSGGTLQCTNNANRELTILLGGD